VGAGAAWTARRRGSSGLERGGSAWSRAAATAGKRRLGERRCAGEQLRWRMSRRAAVVRACEPRRLRRQASGRYVAREWLAGRQAMQARELGVQAALERRGVAGHGEPGGAAWPRLGDSWGHARDAGMRWPYQERT
jgi:hypothetical protein